MFQGMFREAQCCFVRFVSECLSGCVSGLRSAQSRGVFRGCVSGVCFILLVVLLSVGCLHTGVFAHDLHTF